MTRHSKNCTANSVYSYHEKKKDGEASGFGSLRLRFSKDSVKDFDCCCLSLHPCREPVITKDGYLYEKESIIEYIIAKKNENSRALKEYEAQCKKEKADFAELDQAYERSKVERFLSVEKSVLSTSFTANSNLSMPSGSTDVPKVTRGDKTISSFWIPTLTPENKLTKLKKPDKKVFCPMSGTTLKLKDMIAVKFTLAENDGASIEGKKHRYKCPVTGDWLRNNVPCAVLAPTGDVVTMECVNMIKKDMIHPLTGQKLIESDIIPLYRGGTGFASVNNVLVGKKARPSLQV